MQQAHECTPEDPRIVFGAVAKSLTLHLRSSKHAENTPTCLCLCFRGVGLFFILAPGCPTFSCPACSHLKLRSDTPLQPIRCGTHTKARHRDTTEQHPPHSQSGFLYVHFRVSSYTSLCYCRKGTPQAV